MFSPIKNTSRIEVVDALRGFALLGIIIANIPFPYNSETIFNDRLWTIGTPSVDATLEILFHWFVDKKFLAIFAALFGFGFYIQLKRAREKGIDFKPYFLKRMLWLLAIGCIHAYLIWFGDIIRDYALCGMLLLLFVRHSDNNIFRAAVIFSVFGTGLVFILNGIFEMNTTYPYDLALLQEFEYASSYERYLQINFTIDPFVNFIHDSPLTLSFSLGCMLFGYWLGRISFFENPEKYKRMINIWIGTGCTGGILASIGYWMIIKGKLELDLPIIWLVFLIIMGMLFQSLAYIGLFVSSYSIPRFRKFLSIFVPIGRMALTNYIMQSVFFTVFFFHWFPGLQWFGKLTMTETYLVALMIFSLQLGGSYFWQKRFKRGPLEFVWRKLSYIQWRSPGRMS